MPDIFLDADPDNPLCDFCSSENPYWEFQIEAGHEIGHDQLPGGEIHSMDRDGRWAACDACKELIVKRQNSVLAKRSTASFFSKHGIPATEKNWSIAIPRVRQAHNFFFALWDGSEPIDRRNDA